MDWPQGEQGAAGQIGEYGPVGHSGDQGPVQFSSDRELDLTQSSDNALKEASHSMHEDEEGHMEDGKEQSSNIFQSNNTHSSSKGSLPVTVKVKVSVNFIDPSNKLEIIRDKIVTQLHSEGLHLQHEPSGPCLVIVNSSSKISSDLNRDLRK